MRLLLALLLFLAPTPLVQPSKAIAFPMVCCSPCKPTRRDRSTHRLMWTAARVWMGRTGSFLFSLNAGESFAKTIHAIPGVVPGGVTMRVWTSDDAPVIALRVSIPARAGVQHVYVPFALH
jgi:hypothetical protein